jgi:hypothetical protein
VSFDDAATVFGDPLAATVPDPDHSADEARSITIWQSASQLLVVVVRADRGEISDHQCLHEARLTSELRSLSPVFCGRDGGGSEIVGLREWLSGGSTCTSDESELKLPGTWQPAHEPLHHGFVKEADGEQVTVSAQRARQPLDKPTLLVAALDAAVKCRAEYGWSPGRIES